ncbi:(2Fe-2S) ferredoxin domain-containing protein [Candidatus Parcubacteria bacterium]|jgi:NADH:ubiquinone oxidoreductase subunit E|nr:(2Fe-2S) ferredoxin domain-containing protein [Candidatus Parcubacteria bacterium]MBT3948511.1 (2Fe-2S) ferredoxin domain-containing protein [Candidatus Parcubacteria bacterium]
MSSKGKIPRSSASRDGVKVEVCCGENCSARNSQKVFDTLKKEFENTEKCGCLGNCGKGLNVLIDEKRILHYSKEHNIVERVKSDEGEVFKRFTEEELTDDFLKDI